MKKLLLSLSALMFMTGISFADSLVDVKELTFGENLLYNNCIPSFMYESTIMNDEYLTTLTLRELFFQFSYRGNFENIDIYSGGLSAMYFFSNKFFVDTSANIGYYSKHDESNYSDSESGLYTDLQCGIGADFTICDGGLYLFTKVNLAVSNICPFYYSFSIGIRTPILSLAGLGEGASRGSFIAR